MKERKTCYCKNLHLSFFQLLMQEDVRQYVMQNISSISSLPLIPPPPPSNKTPRTRFSENRQNSSQNSHHTPHPSPPNRSYPAAQTPIKANQISTAGVNKRHCVLRLLSYIFIKSFVPVYSLVLNRRHASCIRHNL